jgi:hypothetical protein
MKSGISSNSAPLVAAPVLIYCQYWATVVAFILVLISAFGGGVKIVFVVTAKWT